MWVFLWATILIVQIANQEPSGLYSLKANLLSTIEISNWPYTFLRSTADCWCDCRSNEIESIVKKQRRLNEDSPKSSGLLGRKRKSIDKGESLIHVKIPKSLKISSIEDAKKYSSVFDTKYRYYLKLAREIESTKSIFEELGLGLKNSKSAEDAARASQHIQQKFKACEDKIRASRDEFIQLHQELADIKSAITQFRAQADSSL